MIFTTHVLNKKMEIYCSAKSFLPFLLHPPSPFLHHKLARKPVHKLSNLQLTLAPLALSSLLYFASYSLSLPLSFFHLYKWSLCGCGERKPWQWPHDPFYGQEKNVIFSGTPATSLASCRVQMVTFEEKLFLFCSSLFLMEKYPPCSHQDDQNVFLTSLQLLPSPS